jgi:hypothetical protein
LRIKTKREEKSTMMRRMATSVAESGELDHGELAEAMTGWLGVTEKTHG